MRGGAADHNPTPSHIGIVGGGAEMAILVDDAYAGKAVDRESIRLLPWSNCTEAFFCNPKPEVKSA